MLSCRLLFGNGFFKALIYCAISMNYELSTCLSGRNYLGGSAIASCPATKRYPNRYDAIGREPGMALN